MRRLLGSPWFFYGLAALLLVVGVVSQLDIRTPSRPVKPIEAIQTLRDRDDVNVIFILIDTLRADHLSSYGHSRDTSPTLDQLAQYGIRFSRVHAQSSWTKASMASMWLGQNPQTTGITRFTHGLSEESLMPAEIMKQAGFRTAGIYRNGWVAANFGFAQGFDMYYKPVPNRIQERYEQARKTGQELQGTDLDNTEAAIEFIRSHASERFFLYIHNMDVHQYLYEESYAKFGTGYKDAYDNAIAWTDRNVAMLVQALDEMGLFEKTILVIGSDHGEAFLEHGREGHAQDVYAEVTDVPLILSLPFRLAKPVVVEPVVRNIDVFPTILDMLGLQPLPDAEGISLVPLIEATARGEAVDGLVPGEAVAHLDQTWGRMDDEPAPMVGYQQDGFRAIHYERYPEDTELYDKVADPAEQHDVAMDHAEQTAALRGKVQEYLAREPILGSREVEIDEMQVNQLRALGYMIDNLPKKKSHEEDPE